MQINEIIGKEIRTVKDGVGVIRQIERTRITVEFSNGTKKEYAPFPDVFFKYLFPVDEEMKSLAEQAIAENKTLIEKEEAERWKATIIAILKKEGNRQYLRFTRIDESLLHRLWIYEDFIELYNQLRDMFMEAGSYNEPKAFSTYERMEQAINRAKEGETKIPDHFFPVLAKFIDKHWKYFYDNHPDHTSLIEKCKTFDVFNSMKKIIGPTKNIYSPIVPFSDFISRIAVITGTDQSIPSKVKPRMLAHLAATLGNKEDICKLYPNKVLSDSPRFFIIYDSLKGTSCNRLKHNVITVIGRIKSKNTSSGLYVPFHYCTICKKYFIGSSSLRCLTTEFDEFDIQYEYDNETLVSDSNPDYSLFEAQSDLYKTGYNVKKKGMSEWERKELLVRVYESGELKDFQIRRDLENAISQFSDHPNFEEAVQKWNADLQFFTQYLLQSNQKTNK